MLSAESPRLTRFNAYLKERFPLGSFLPLIILFTCALSYSGQVINRTVIDFFDLNLLIGLFVLLLVFFHLRLFDEFKDYENDLSEHPDRLVSRGVITLQELRYLTLSVLLVEVLLVIQLSPLANLAYVITLVFSLLMFKEFFLGELLRGDMLIYAISHQAIILFMAWFGLNLQTDVYLSLQTPQLAAIGAVFLASSFAFELSRKIHDPEKSEPLLQAYSKYLGWKKLGIGVVVLFMLASIAFWQFIEMSHGSLWLVAIQGAITFCMSVMVMVASRNPTPPRVKQFQTWTALHMLLLFMNLMVNSYLLRGGV